MKLENIYAFLFLFSKQGVFSFSVLSTLDSISSKQGCVVEGAKDHVLDSIPVDLFQILTKIENSVN